MGEPIPCAACDARVPTSHCSSCDVEICDMCWDNLAAHLPSRPANHGPHKKLKSRPVLCAVCYGNVESSSYCSACGANFCDKCWPIQIPHQPGRTSDKPHEKSDPEITKRLQEILTPATDPKEQKQLHLNDSDTTWLRYTKASFLLEPELLEFPRYKKIMQDSLTYEWKERWPQLVAFIGQTGDGKSTIIKMLIESQKRDTGNDFPSPVVGGIGTSVPTSADIHLYADPESYYTRFPCIYADCEGLTGGERAPMANQAMPDETYLQRLREKSLSARRRKLRFAIDDESRKREYTVRELYPRLLYTFSHVVVFVLANERHPLLKDEEYDVDTATRKLLSDADQSLAVNPDIIRHAESWQRSHAKEIRNAKDLLKCYYSSFKVVRIPEKGRYMLIDQQVRKLQEAISSCCRGSHEHKIQARRDLNADELGECLQKGLDHFTSSLEIPFDLLAFSWSLNPIPSGLEGNILRLALLIRSIKPDFRGKDIFQNLSHMVASCIMLDYVRDRIRGGPLENLEHYKPVLDNALDTFCGSWWPCSYQSVRGKRCINTRDGHARGHQDERGKQIGDGEYRSDFFADDYRFTWHGHLETILMHIQRLMERRRPVSPLRDQLPDEAHEAAEQHLVMMHDFYHKLGGAHHFQSNKTCLSCLRDMPEHPLPCGHVICSLCVRTFGESRSKTTFFLSQCPLHNDKRWGIDVKVSLKPPLAGVRVLSLDGGGIRGIVELQILEEIERELGGRIRVQEFFDLIVSTSTGGIIALGLGVQNWPVQDCIQKFKNLCGKAFTEREFHGVPILEQLATATHMSKYKNEPFDDALRENFGTDLLFGGHSQPQHYARNFAVTTTTAVGSEPRILANYNRHVAESPGYNLERRDKKKGELKIYEAARATSAAIPYFKSFRSEETGQEYVDGAMYHNNPIKVANEERKLLWPDVGALEPDILVSIGTGKSSVQSIKNTESRKQLGRKWSRLVPKVFRILFARMHDILDSERAWSAFYHDVVGGDSAQRYVRINPELSIVPPALDEKDKLLSLEADVRQSWASRSEVVREVADRLLASCFYFDKANVQPKDYQIVGQIRCRFEDGTDNLRSLGNYLRLLQVEDHSPYFTVNEVHPELSLVNMDVVPISQQTVEAMTRVAKFSVPDPIINISSWTARTRIGLVLRPNAISVSISGFPRQLGCENEISQYRQKSEREADRAIPIRYKPDSANDASRSTGPPHRRLTLLRHNNDKPKRSKSAPALELPIQGGKDVPETPSDVADWVRRLPEPDLSELDDASMERFGSLEI